MKLISIIIGLFVASNLYAADIFYYTDIDSKSEFVVLSSINIGAYTYDESDKELNVYVDPNYHPDFKVGSKKEAMEIIKKLLDRSNGSLIELEKS